MAVIVIAGRPEGIGFLTHLANSLQVDGHEIRLLCEEGEQGIPRHYSAAADIIITAGVACDAGTIATSPKLRAIVSPLIGIDGIDIDAASRAGVLVANGATRENAVSMAEATFMLILAALYNLPGSLAAGAPGAPRPSPASRTMLDGKTIGIWGYGAIARAFLERLHAWNVTVVLHNRTPPRALPGNAAFVDIKTLLSCSDILVMLLRLTPETHHCLNAQRLATMKSDAVLINTSRGGLIDESALADWLRDEPGRRAALDVFETEPLPADSPLRGLPNIILTPHCAGHTSESIAAMTRDTLTNIRELLAGRASAATCNSEISTRWEARWAGASKRRKTTADGKA